MTEKLKLPIVLIDVRSPTDEDLRNRKVWTVEKILSEAYFHCDEERQKHIEEIVISRGSGTLWKRYLEAIRKKELLKKLYDQHYREERLFLYAEGFENADDILYDLNPKHIWIFSFLRREYYADLRTTPPASDDSNSSRKQYSTITRKDYLQKLKTEMLQTLTNGGVRKTPATSIIKHLINLYK